jgi:hypothetical protein
VGFNAFQNVGGVLGGDLNDKALLLGCYGGLADNVVLFDDFRSLEAMVLIS